MKKIFFITLLSIGLYAMPPISGVNGIVFNAKNLKLIHPLNNKTVDSLKKKYHLKDIKREGKTLYFYSSKESDVSKITFSLLRELMQKGFIKSDLKTITHLASKMKKNNLILFYKAKECPALPAVVEERIAPKDFRESFKKIKKEGFYSVQNNCKVELDKKLCPVLKCFR